jgi:hypothetical protein
LVTREIVAYLHLCAAVLEPELDLARVKAEPLAELAALLLVRVRALLEQPTHAARIYA